MPQRISPNAEILGKLLLKPAVFSRPHSMKPGLDFVKSCRDNTEFHGSAEEIEQKATHRMRRVA